MSSAFAAGYSCPAYKKYTSCNAGYYLNGTGAGNSCSSCTGVSFTNSGTDTTTDSSGCTATSQTVSGSISGGGSYTQYQTRTGSRTGTRSKSQTCYRTGGAGGTSGSSACTGMGNCGAWSYGSWSYGACNYTAWANSGARKITCPAGTYWNGSGCASCGTGYYCAGFNSVDESSLLNGYGRKSCTNAPANANYTGSATTNSCAWSCKAGYYGSSAAGSTSCADCGSGNYCTGGTHRATCASTVLASAPIPTNIISVSSGSWLDFNHATSTSDCVCEWYFSDDVRTQYMNQRLCSEGPGGNNYTHYNWCRTGYYATEPLNFNNWYNNCAACTNGPANSTYTSYSTPSQMYAVESNCPWQCNTGFYKSGDSCVACPSAYPYSDAGATSVTQCYSGTKKRAWNGSQIPCAKPSGCAAVQCNACSKSTCDYVAYANSAGTGDGDVKSGCTTNNASCNQTVASVTAASGYYVNRLSCPACSGVGDGSYTLSVNGNTGGNTQCYKICSRACTQQACPANATCMHGTTSTSGVQYYGGACNAAASTCTMSFECNNGYNLTSGNICAQLCTAGATHLKTGTGVSIPLYSAPQSVPAINVGYNGDVCYGTLATGAASGTFNVKYGGSTYHAVQ